VIRDGNIWALWRNIAKQDPSFGQPDKFCTQPDKTVLTSASLTTLDDKIPPTSRRSPSGTRSLSTVDKSAAASRPSATPGG